MTAAAVSDTSKHPDEYRLPTDVKPTHYELTIRTDLVENKFDGLVNIHLDVLKDTSILVFNVASLTLGDATLSSAALPEGSLVQPASAFTIDTKTERASVPIGTTLPAGSKAQLKVSFEGALTGSMMGYYRSVGEHEDKPLNYSLTQFEPTAARKAFPCWDEPLLKATFAITMVSRADTVNLSNMPAASEVIYQPDAQPSSEKEPTVSWVSEKLAKLRINASADKWKITKFETTPPMSTYIVAFANGPFVYLESSHKSPLSGKIRPLRIYTTADHIHQAQFALDIKKMVLPIYERIFDIEYPLPKLDTLVASDFDSGAMENWGLITGRTSVFLIDPKKSNLNTRKQVANTQSHEVAHMWFGNITTMAWWDNLYLNEGFATLIGQLVVLDKVFPEWKLNADFISTYLGRALGTDAKLSSHPIEVECPDANMINQIFDGLSYAKAGSVLRMLLNYVGEEKFLKGVSIYLKKHLFENSVTKDLWEGIEAASGVGIPKMMDNWVKKMGFPVVTVSEMKDGIRVRQDRFLESGPAKDEDNQTIWTIPLALAVVSADGKTTVNRELVLDEREKTITLDTSKPFKLNSGTTGVYRVLYTPERLEAIAGEAAKEPSPFSLEDRIGLVHDAFALAGAGFLKTSGALTLVETLRAEKEYVVISSIAENLYEIISTWYENEKIVDALNGLRRDLFGPIVRRLGYDYKDEEDYDTRQLRTCAIEQAAKAGDEEVVKQLTSRFAHYVKTGDDSNIHPDFERVTYQIAVMHGGRTEYDAVKKIIEKPKTPAAAISAMLAMSASPDPTLLEETWQWSMTKARTQDLMYLFVGMQRNLKARKFLVRKFKEYYDVVYKRLEDNFGIQNIVKFSINGLSSETDYDDVEKFFKGKDTSKYYMALQQSLDGIRSKATWIERSTADILEWLESREKLAKS